MIQESGSLSAVRDPQAKLTLLFKYSWGNQRPEKQQTALANL